MVESTLSEFNKFIIIIIIIIIAGMPLTGA